MAGLWSADGTLNLAYRPDFSTCVLPYCQWYQDDFLGGVRGMTSAVIGVYTILLNEMYARGEALSLPKSRLSRMTGSSPSGFQSALGLLHTEGKILMLNAGLWNDRVETAFLVRRNQKASNSKAGVLSVKKRNEIKESSQRAFNERSAGVEPRSEAQKSSSSSSGAGAQANIHSEEDQGEKIPPGFLADLRQASGVSDAALSSYWMDPALEPVVKAWIGAGLSHAQILSVARKAFEKHGGAADGPKALQRGMEAVLRTRSGPKMPAKAAPEQPASEASKLQFYADWVNSDRLLPNSTISPSLAQQIVAAGLTTIDRLKERRVI